MLKKLTALLLALVMTLSFSACSKNKDDKKDKSSASTTEKIQDATVKKALNLIDKGDLYGAYDLLYNTKERNEAQEELFNKFQFELDEEYWTENGQTIFTRKYTYNDDGYLLSCNIIAKESDYFDEGYTQNETASYDKNNNLLYYNLTEQDGDIYNVTHTYDKNGNMLSSKYGKYVSEEFTYHGNGQVASYTYKNSTNDYGPIERIETYDKKGNILTKKSTYNLLNKGETTYDETTYNYDKNGNILSEKTIYHDGSQSKDEYTYDKKGNMIDEYHSYSNGDWTKNVYTYDKNGNITTKTHTDSDEKNVTYTYTYDKNNNLVAENQSGETTKYTYDKNGNILTKEITFTDGSYSKETFNYNKDGKLTEREISGPNEYYEKENYTYNNFGDVLEYNFVKSTGEFTNKTSKYDKQGRLIEYIEINNSTSETMTYSYDEEGNQLRREFGYDITCDKYGNNIKWEIDSNDPTDTSWIDNSWGFVMNKNSPNKYYKHKLFYYPNGAPQVTSAQTSAITYKPRTEIFDANGKTFETSNFYYKSNRY